MKYSTLLLLSLCYLGKLFAQTSDSNMVLIPAGSFEMGCNYNKPDLPCMPSTYPAHNVYLDAFMIDKEMVTYERYNKCIADQECKELFAGAGCNAGMPWNKNHPVNCVDYDQAKTFCEWEGKRLLTEAEWEKAARGTDGRIFPWGNNLPNCNLVVMNDQPFVPGVMGPGCGAGTTQPVGSKPNGASPYGVLDMSGQLWEWTQDWYSDTYFQNSPTNNPQGPSSGTYKVIKGGGDWGMRSAREVVANIRFKYAPLGQGYLLGFRCAKDAPTTSVKAPTTELKTLVYPNPAEQEVQLRNDELMLQVEVFDVNGRLIKSLQNLNSKSHQLDVGAFQNGIYIIKVQTQEAIETFKIIKK